MCIDSVIHPGTSDIGNCNISTSGLVVSALCFYSAKSSSIGFQLVVQEKHVDEVRRLLINTTQTGQPQGPVTVQVAMGGAYHVAVFPVKEELGILNSSVAYTIEIQLGKLHNLMILCGFMCVSMF